jgi:hypothetical protein
MTQYNEKGPLLEPLPEEDAQIKNPTMEDPKINIQFPDLDEWFSPEDCDG